MTQGEVQGPDVTGPSDELAPQGLETPTFSEFSHKCMVPVKPSSRVGLPSSTGTAPSLHHAGMPAPLGTWNLATAPHQSGT